MQKITEHGQKSRTLFGRDLPGRSQRACCGKENRKSRKSFGDTGIGKNRGGFAYTDVRRNGKITENPVIRQSTGGRKRPGSAYGEEKGQGNALRFSVKAAQKEERIPQDGADGSDYRTCRPDVRTKIRYALEAFLLVSSFCCSLPGSSSTGCASGITAGNGEKSWREIFVRRSALSPSP